MEAVNKYIAKGFDDNKDAVHTDPVPTSSDPNLINEIKAKLDSLKREKADYEAMQAIEVEEANAMQSDTNRASKTIGDISELIDNAIKGKI